MNTQKQTSNTRPGKGATPRLAFGRVRTMFLTLAILAALGMTTTLRADRVGHDVSAGNVTVSNTTVLPTLPTDAGTELLVPVTVNGFDIINNHNISDHKIKIGATEADDVAGGVLISAVSENLRDNRGSNMTHTVSMSVVNSFLSYEVASQSVPLAASASIEDNVNFASAWFPYSTWYAGAALNSSNANPGWVDTFIANTNLVLGTHFRTFWTNSVVSDAAGNGTYFVDLRGLGVDSRRDGVLLVNHARNEANYALSRVNNDDDEMDGTWTLNVHDNRNNAANSENDPVAFVFVPKSNTNVVSGMFMGDSTIAIYSGATPAFTVTNISSGQYEIKIPGRSPADGVLIISAAGLDSINGDNIVTYQPNTAGDGWIIQTRDLPNAGLQNMATIDPMEPVCSFVFIPAEKPGVTVTPNKNLQTKESGETVQFTVTVNGYPKPTANVTIDLSSSDTGEGTVSPASLTFTPADWNVPQTVTITGVDDGDVDGTQPYTINLTPTTSTDPGFNGLVPGDVAAINIDNEAGVSVDASSLSTTEAGGTNTFSVWLTTAPTDDVTVPVSSSDTTEATVSPASLTFTPANYATPQVVTVTGVNDDVQDGNIAYTIIIAAATSTDGAYNNFDALDIAGQNLDNDLARVIIPASVVTVTEPGSTAQFAVELGSEPTNNVTITFASSDLSEGTVTPSIIFTPGDWNVPQNVTVTAADDQVNDGTVEFTIVTSVSSSDAVYAAINPDDVSARTIDNEADFALPSGDFTYGIGEPATGIDGYATVSDPDTADYNGGGLTVTITAGGTGSDRLDVRNTGTGPGQIGVSGSTVSYEGVAIGTKSGGTGLTALAITFTNAAATPAAAEALARAVTYQNVDANASPQSRTVSFALADGDGGVSTVTKTIIIRLLRIYSFQESADGGFGVYNGALDTQIHHQFPTTSYPAGYSANGLWIDYDPASLIPTDQMQCFLKFTNLFGTGPGQIPVGAKIVFAELIMNVTDSGHGARFNRMLGDWDEGVTFDSLGSGIQLDDAEAVSGTNSFLGEQPHTTTTGGGLKPIAVTSDVQAWADGANNYGWVMSTWEGGENGTAFSPCEATNIVLRPRLRVGWLPASASVASFQEGTGGYTGQVDSQIRMVAPDTQYSANTTLSPDWVQSTAPGAPVPNQQQVLIRFDDIIGTGTGQVPSGSTIHAAILDLTSITGDSQGSGGQFHALRKTWNPTDTWNIWAGGIAADDVEAASSPTTTLPVDGLGTTVQSTRHAVELTTDVQAWVSGTPNYGWAILPWPNGSNGWGFNSADSAPVEMRPQLRVYYTPPVMIQWLDRTATTVTIKFTGDVGKTYTVLRSGTVASGYGSVGTAQVQPDGTATFVDNSPLPGAAFYRISYP